MGGGMGCDCAVATCAHPSNKKVVARAKAVPDEITGTFTKTKFLWFE